MSDPQQKATAGRRFGVADGLILVAATAAGMAGSRALAPDVTWAALRNVMAEIRRNGWQMHLIMTVFFAEIGAFLLVPCLVTWTLAYVLLRMRSPRPARRRLVRLPGAMACLVATAVIGLSAAVGLVLWAMTEPGNLHRTQRNFGTILFGSLQVGAAVLWCWVTMALCGRWRPEPTWLDRLGRALGAAWIAIAVSYGYVTVALWPF